jgi:hypothetical protein
MCAERLPGDQKNSLTALASARSSWGAGPVNLVGAHQDRAQRDGPRIFFLPLMGSRRSVHLKPSVATCGDVARL